METMEQNALPAPETGGQGADAPQRPEPGVGESGQTLPEGGSPALDSAQAQRQLETIARMDPEMTDLGAILRSEAGPGFREYVAKGLDFVDAYTLAARDRLARLEAARTLEAARIRAAGKEHLSATRSRGGEGDLPVPAEELELFRALLPGTPDAEFRKYWNRNRKK